MLLGIVAGLAFERFLAAFAQSESVRFRSRKVAREMERERERLVNILMRYISVADKAAAALEGVFTTDEQGESPFSAVQ